ncbi:response regulator [Oscillibacter sp. MSJ-2]|uniref:Response regulator n=1 Tax=Dysosmobacter acutus TaxID=2841504 RepID=A0ABS6F9P5_9FIRM|nr:ATP-binding protein [Dysosmobacter acutus]MBU5627018.1 response regulator [Dysosmobacter acutus]
MCNDNLKHLLDALTETSVYVIEAESRKLLYFNQRCRELGRGRAKLGARCCDVWPEVCANCPLAEMGTGTSSHIVCYDPLLKTTVDATANRILWDGHIPAVVITATPHRLNFEEEQGEKKVKEMYAQSLVTVFSECIIANLTKDYYVNCQKDSLWTDIPDQGSFGSENLTYSKKAVHPDDLSQFQDNFSRESMLRLFASGRRQITKRLRRLTGDGTYHMVEFTATQLERFDDQDCWCVLIYRDIQEEYLLEQKMNLDIAQLAMAAKVSYQMLISINLTQNTYRMLEYDRLHFCKAPESGCFDELVQLGISIAAPEFQTIYAETFSRQHLLEAFAQGGQSVSLELRQLGEDDQYHWTLMQVMLVPSDATDDVLVMAMSKCIDEERRRQEADLERERQSKLLLEEALQKAERASQAKSDFLSRMSHDIRTPMNAIMGMTELAQHHIQNEDRLREYLEKISDSSAHLLGLINEVLDVSKIESGTVELDESEFDLRDLVRDAVTMVQLAVQSKAQHLVVQIDQTLHSQVLGDRQRLCQVLVNLLDNASKYTAPQGEIRLLLEEVKKNTFQMGTYRFMVEDNGIGMTPEFVEHIFEPFSRADDAHKVTGTGLGMTIVQNIVSLMGGSVVVESEYGRGSRFTITLSLAQAAASPAQAAPASYEEVSLTGVRILLAEDNALNQQIALEMLKLLGVEVEIAEDGRQAVEAVLHHPPFYYDAVFMDIRMPNLNGYEATRQIRDSHLDGINELPIIAMTADAFAEDVRKTKLSGLNGHLMKPISIEQLRNTLVQCIQWKRRNHPAPQS